MSNERYSIEDAANEAEIVHRKVMSGEAQSYAEAERQLEEGSSKTRENDIARIEAESRQVAEIKLQKLLGEDFKDYAIRFANIKEYEKILQKKQVSGGETFVPKLSKWIGYDDWTFGEFEFKHKRPLSFEEYLANKGNGGSWQETAILQTYWPNATEGMRSQHSIAQMYMGYAREKVREEFAGKEKGHNINLKNETLRVFRDLVLQHAREESSVENFSFEILLEKFITLEDLLKKVPDSTREQLSERIEALLRAQSDVDALNEVKKIEEVIKTMSISSEDKKSWDDLLEMLGSDIKLGIFNAVDSENRLILNKFVTEPDFIFQPGNLRKVVTALTMSLRMQKDQYHVALVFDSAAVSDKQSWAKAKGFVESEKKEWRILKSAKEDPNQAQELLGAIVVMSDRKIVEQIVNLSSRAREFSHPVFDVNGFTKYP